MDSKDKVVYRGSKFEVDSLLHDMELGVAGYPEKEAITELGERPRINKQTIHISLTDPTRLDGTLPPDNMLMFDESANINKDYLPDWEKAAKTALVTLHSMETVKDCDNNNKSLDIQSQGKLPYRKGVLPKWSTENLKVRDCVKLIKKAAETNSKLVYLPNISIKTATHLKDMGYRLSPRLMDKNEEFYYKVYLA